MGNEQGQIGKYKARLVAKGYTQEEGVDYNETLSPVSTKDSFRVIMALVAHFDLHLHQMDVKTTFVNGDLIEEIYMKQPGGFASKGEENLVCRLQKSIYGLKQASRQWYLKFDEVVKSQGFIDNPLDELNNPPKTEIPIKPKPSTLDCRQEEGAAMAWKSMKQQYVSTSTMQAEFLAVYKATSIAMWLKTFMSMLRVVYSIQRPIQLWNDNTAAIFIHVVIKVLDVIYPVYFDSPL
ncbi:hypothetical protein Prudu_009033 [Prunus dulcis]|uniref:Reverse transcriptase Ty1/copia-type domain-containing protein n=1 Tax=Prunus dulcis TaxID=3755 RepID=A0A4Y1R5V9_PRUDU|nr:hypothetical protein Prudu_009033 [Prunus dulcis]